MDDFHMLMFRKHFNFFLQQQRMWWIIGGHTVHNPLEWLLPETGFEPAPFQNFRL